MMLESSARMTENTSGASNQNNLMHLCIKAAAARCTLGEMSLALENAWGRHVAIPNVIKGAYQSSFVRGDEDSTSDECNKITNMVEDFESREGRRPKILVAKMGQDGHDRGSKVIASGFSDLGFDVDIGPLFQTPEEVVLQALDSDVHVIGISSQAAGHKTLLPALKRQLEKAGADHIIVVVGGVIPHSDYDFLLNEEKCCSAIFGPGTRITDACVQVLNLIPCSENESSFNELSGS